MSFGTNSVFVKSIENLQAYQNEGLNTSQVEKISKAEKALQSLIEKMDQWNKEKAILLFRCIFNPFAVKTLEMKNDKLSMPMVDLITEWINKRPKDLPTEPIIKLLKLKDVYDLKYLKVIDCVENKFKLVKISKEQEFIDLAYLFQLFSIKSSANQRDNLVELIKKIVKSIEQSKETSNLFGGNLGDDTFNFEELWSLYFDPLIIEKIINSRRMIQDEIGKVDLTLSNNLKFPVLAKWSDDLSGKLTMASNHRSRIDEILIFILKCLFSKSKQHLFAQFDRMPYLRIGDSLKTFTEEKKRFVVSQSIKLMDNLLDLDQSEEFTTEVYENFIRMTNELKFMAEDRIFRKEIHDKVINQPWLVKNKLVIDFFKNTSDLVLNDSELKESWKALTAQLKGGTNDIDSVFSLLHEKLITIKTRNIGIFDIVGSLDWCKDFIPNQQMRTKLLESKVLDKIALIAPRRIFNTFLSFYHETFNTENSKYFLHVLPEIYEESMRLKLLKEGINNEDIKLLQHTLSKFSETDGLSINSWIFLIDILASSEHFIMNNTSLTQLFTNEEIFDVLLSSFEQKDQSLDVYSRLFKFLLKLAH